jgi:hypothetical protein
MSVLRRQDGQVAALAAVFMVSILGMAALVLDVGSWFRAQRATQAAADAAALAGAQALPHDPGRAIGLAGEYAETNGGGLEAGDVGLSGELVENDTITVELSRSAPGFFAKVFGIDSVTVEATAAARAGAMTQAKWVAPIVVNEKHPDLLNFGESTELEYYHLKTSGTQNDGAGSFGFINLTGEGGVGSNQLGDWISEGFDEYLYANQNYTVSTGNPFSSSNIEAALEAKLSEGLALLFPIYDTLTGTGDNAEYHIVGFAAFVITDIDFHGENEIIHGHFESITWEGILAESPGEAPPDFGVKSVSLVG